MFTFNSTDAKEDHGESVFNLVKQSQREIRQQFHAPGYVSRYACKVRQEAACRKIGSYMTMGCPSVFRNQPHKFLRKFTGGEPCFWKNQKHQQQPSSQENVICTHCNLRVSSTPVIPKAKVSLSEPERTHRLHCEYSKNFPEYEGASNSPRNSYSEPLLLNKRHVACQTEDGEEEELPVEEDDCCKFGRELTCQCGCDCGGRNRNNNGRKTKKAPRVPLCPTNFNYIERGQKDFIRDNAIAVLRCPPKIPQRRVVDGANGHTSAWIPKQRIGKPGFGTIPPYLIKRKQELYEQEQAIRREMEMNAKIKYVPKEERDWIIEGLQRDWNEANDDFKLLPIVQNQLSPKLLKRKVALEDKMDRLEKELRLFRRNGPLLVSDVRRSNYAKQ